jgi:hypothetical protein
MHVSKDLMWRESEIFWEIFWELNKGLGGVSMQQEEVMTKGGDSRRDVVTQLHKASLKVVYI